ncbi:TrmH family RNA methyltransferase [Haloferula sp.]|uniref:TrmH family RNA methyltransferase n=1 Tax=Haloferula sp. TaxID=2497595 RepID=UPI003C73F2DF
MAATASGVDADPDWINELKSQIHQREDPWVVLEGRAAVEAAVAGWWDLKGILASEACGWEPPLWSGLELLKRPHDTLEAFANSAHHGGVIALARQPDETGNVAGLMAELESDALVVVCPSLVEPTTAGEIIRNAAALGAKAVIFGREGASPFDQRAVKASAGALFRIPVRVADGGQALRCLKGAGFQLIGAEAGAGTKPVDSAEIEPGRIALVLGSEDGGLGPFWKAACDELLHLPTPKAMDSLGVSAASAVLLWEIARLRQGESEESA